MNRTILAVQEQFATLTLQRLLELTRTICVCSVISLICGMHAVAQLYDFQTLPIECSVVTSDCALRARGINAQGDIVGWEQEISSDPTSRIAGFLLDRHGELTVIEFPGSPQTRASSINEVGEIVGSYEDADGLFHGFFRDREGNYSTIDFPGAFRTAAWGINNKGQIVGNYSKDGGLPAQGFLRNKDGTYEEIDVPSATYSTLPRDINDHGVIVGDYEIYPPPVGLAAEVHGFLLDTDGIFTTIDFPAVPIPFPFVFTQILGINNRGEIAGAYIDDGSTRAAHGFFRNVEGDFTEIDFPGASATAAFKISEKGDLVGWYRTSGMIFAFVAHR